MYEKFVNSLIYISKLSDKPIANVSVSNELQYIGIKCLLELQKHLYHFNFAIKINEILINQLLSPN